MSKDKSPAQPEPFQPKNESILASQAVIHHRLDINLQPNYPIYVGENIYDSASLIASHLGKKCTQILIITNEKIAPFYITQLENNLKSYFQSQMRTVAIHTLILPDGESYKNFEQLQKILDNLLSLNFDRYAALIALGGGVIGDIVGFAASIYQRGIDFIQMPSTLLAQVDSSVGGKTAINHPRGKNMIGTFWQPKAVIMDVLLLNTLDQRTFSSGIAEMIKHGLIYDEAYLDFLEANSTKIQKKDPKVLARAIQWACQIKCEIVARDEKEASIRAYLNLGHTFGHAIEAAAGYGRYLHGEAVAIGMVMALKWSVQYEGLDEKISLRIQNLLKAYQLPICLEVEANELNVDIKNVDNFLNYMRLDKKNHQGLINLILVKKIASVFIRPVEEKNLRDFLTQVI